MSFVGTLTLLAGLAGPIGIVCWIRKAAPRLVVACGLLVGAGLSGWLGTRLAHLGAAVGATSDKIGTKLLGVGLSGGIAAALIAWLYFDLRKKGKVSKAAPVVALVVPFMLPALWGALSQIEPLRELGTGVQTFYAEVR